jgi:hypothetical protein
VNFVERGLTAQHFGYAALIEACHAALAGKPLQIPFVPTPLDLAAKIGIDQEKFANGCAALEAGLRAFTAPGRPEHAPAVARRTRITESCGQALCGLGIDWRFLRAARAQASYETLSQDAA